MSASLGASMTAIGMLSRGGRQSPPSYRGPYRGEGGLLRIPPLLLFVLVVIVADLVQVVLL